MTITNNGVINANKTNKLIIDPNANGPLNTSIIQASNGGTLRLNGGTYTNTGAIIEALEGSTVELAGATITGGTLHTAGTGIMKNTGTITLDNVTIDNTFGQSNSTTVYLKGGSLTNNGTYSMNSTTGVTDHGNRGGAYGYAEALYVDTLMFSDALSTLNLNGLHLYYNTLIGGISQIIDENVPQSPVPEPSTYLLMTLGIIVAGFIKKRTR